MFHSCFQLLLAESFCRHLYSYRQVQLGRHTTRQVEKTCNILHIPACMTSEVHGSGHETIKRACTSNHIQSQNKLITEWGKNYVIKLHSILPLKNTLQKVFCTSVLQALYTRSAARTRAFTICFLKPSKKRFPSLERFTGHVHL